MPGPPPKNPATRQRRNRTTTAAKLPAGPSRIRAPKLPDREGGWHELVTAAWRDWWASPMAREWVKADVVGLFVLAELLQQFYETGDAKLAAEIRQQRQAYGLTPLDRRRLQWEIERAEDAAERGARRRPSPKLSEGTPTADLGILRAV